MIKHLIASIVILNTPTIKGQNPLHLIDISKNQWEILNDNVMGGISEGKFEVKNDKIIFYGKLSSKFNGGFASIRSREKIRLNNNEKIKLKVVGDGNTYQIRIKDSSYNYYSYAQNFTTNEGILEYITLLLSDFKPVFRGTNLPLENFNKKSIDEISFMIVSKKEPHFELQIIEVAIE